MEVVHANVESARVRDVAVKEPRIVNNIKMKNLLVHNHRENNRSTELISVIASI